MKNADYKTDLMTGDDDVSSMALFVLCVLPYKYCAGE